MDMMGGFCPSLCCTMDPSQTPAPCKPEITYRSTSCHLISKIKASGEEEEENKTVTFRFFFFSGHLYCLAIYIF